MSKEELNCSFCGRAKPQTQLLIAGLDAHICDKCILQAHGIVKEETTEEKVESKFVRKRVQSNVYKKEESFSFLFIILKKIYFFFRARVNLLNQFAQIAPLFKSNNDHSRYVVLRFPMPVYSKNRNL